jgi:glycyl-tRNA synthetase alpha subunit
MAKKAIGPRWTNELMSPNYTDPVKRMRDGQYGESTNNVSLVNKSRHFWREFFYVGPTPKTSFFFYFSSLPNLGNLILLFYLSLSYFFL